MIKKQLNKQTKNEIRRTSEHPYPLDALAQSIVDKEGEVLGRLGVEVDEVLKV